VTERPALEEFKTDVYYILKKLDCYGSSDEIKPFVDALIKFQSANNNYTFEAYEKMSNLNLALWDANRRYTKEVKELKKLILETEQFLDMLFKDYSLSKLFRVELAKARCNICSIKYDCSTVGDPDDCLRVVEGQP
jgi:hypothetical protein